MKYLVHKIAGTLSCTATTSASVELDVLIFWALDVPYAVIFDSITSDTEIEILFDYGSQYTVTLSEDGNSFSLGGNTWAIGA